MRMENRRPAVRPRWTLALLAAISTCGFIDRIIMQVLVEPIKTEFGLSDTQIGLVSGLAFALLNVALGLWVARIAERRRRTTLVWIGTLLWSIATAACGMAGSFLHLLFARISVGVGEAVGLPATHSIVSDLFPRERRTAAMSVLLLAPPIGAFLGSAVGAGVAQAYGWRVAFWVAAAPGILLAILLALTVEEPERGRHDDLGEGAAIVPPLSAVIARMWRRRSLRHMILGSTIAALAGFGLNAFLAAFLLRRFGFSVAQAGLVAGLIASLPATISVLGGGWLADRIARRDARAYGWVPGIALLIAAPVYMLAVTRSDAASAIALLGLASIFQYCYLAPTSGVLQNMMHPRMRASAAAATGLLTSLVGAGLGPLLIGTLSDRFGVDGPVAGTGGGMAAALAAGACLYLWSAAHYLAATRQMRADFAAPIV